MCEISSALLTLGLCGLFAGILLTLVIGVGIIFGNSPGLGFLLLVAGVLPLMIIGALVGISARLGWLRLVNGLSFVLMIIGFALGGNNAGCGAFGF
jgi:hypothetical protein